MSENLAGVPVDCFPRRTGPARQVLAVFLAAAVAVFLSACARELHVSATFNNSSGLATGVPVYLDDAKVGEISGLTRTGATVRARLALDPDLVAALRSGSAALLTTRGGHTVIELYNYRPGGDPLKDDAVLVGLNNSLEYAAWQAGESIDTGTKSMNDLAKTVHDYFQSDEWEQKKNEMNRQFDDLKQQLGRSYDDTNKAYQKFLGDLESQSEEARKQARESYAQLARRLKEQIEHLKQQGNEKLVEPLQRLLDELSRAMAKKPDREST
ncbi:MAG: MlaD family protein [Arenicellales bacterium]